MRDAADSSTGTAARAVNAKASSSGADLSPRAVAFFLLCAALIGWATSRTAQGYSPLAIALASGAMAAAGLSVSFAGGGNWSVRTARRALYFAAMLGAAGALRAMPIAASPFPQWRIISAIVVAVGAILAPIRRGAALALLLISAAAITTLSVALTRVTLDSYQLQQAGLFALLHGVDPYTVRIQSPYTDEANAMYYGPGMVRDGWLQLGYPYPPLTLFFTLPGYLAFGDVRFSLVGAALLSALLMGTARRGVLGYAGAALLAFSQIGPYLLANGWNEPVALLTFSLTMWCACRWPAAMPFALGLFLASKQYAPLLLPLTPLLCPGAGPRKILAVAATAIGVALVITLPLALWNVSAFWMSVVEFQFQQPFRTDSISLGAWAVNTLHWPKPPNLLPLAMLAPALALGLWRGVRSPAGFAAAAAFAMLVFVLFSKQAFLNYYYLGAGMACWAVAATDTASRRHGPSDRGADSGNACGNVRPFR